MRRSDFVRSGSASPRGERPSFARASGFVVLATTLGTLAAMSSGACGSKGTGVDTCRQIESARCRQAPSCPDINLGVPVHISSQSDVDSCISFYNDACLHGLVNTDPGAVEVNQCIAAINGSGDGGGVDCTIVEHPEMSPACYWLIPPVLIDAGSDVDAEDAALDADADAG